MELQAITGSEVQPPETHRGRQTQTERHRGWPHRGPGVCAICAPIMREAVKGGGWEGKRGGEARTTKVVDGTLRTSSGSDGDCVPLVVLSLHADREGGAAGDDSRDLEDVLDEIGAVCICVCADASRSSARARTRAIPYPLYVCPRRQRRHKRVFKNTQPRLSPTPPDLCILGWVGAPERSAGTLSVPALVIRPVPVLVWGQTGVG
jgi:hypothetical protein